MNEGFCVICAQRVLEIERHLIVHNYEIKILELKLERLELESKILPLEKKEESKQEE